MQYEGEHTRVRCGPGCLWSDLIKLLNIHGKSPRTMQSYCSFSVGGTLAVNAHGITTDYCFAESVLEFRLARITSKGAAKVVVCRPPPDSKRKGQIKKSSLSNDLFRLALGGYGLFGVITEVLLKVENNVKLELNTLHLKVQPADNLDEGIHPSEFVRIYDNCRNSNSISNKSGGHKQAGNETNNSSGLGRVELKLARLNTVNLENASLYVFRRSYSSPTVSDLPVAPRELSTASRLLYKWAMPLLKDLRYSKEESSGKAMDWSQDDGSSRNLLLFESAVPLSSLYNPLVTKDDTFVLQEFFCPREKFSQWIDAVKPIYKDIETQQKKYKHELILLNTTIRYVEQDDTTFLSYSRVPGGVFAFVLYYRINRNGATEKRLGDFHNRLAEATVNLGGTFYLPYRKCYSSKLLKAAYPMIDKFAELKERMDPNCLFSNLWFECYILPLCTNGYRTKYAEMNFPQENSQQSFGSTPLRATRLGFKKEDIISEEEFMRQLPRRNQKDVLRRTDSYRNLLRSKELRDQFRNQFLVQIFNLAEPEEVMRVMARAAWDPANNSDIQIYKSLHRHFHGSNENSFDLSSLPRLWRGIQQLRQQKEELTRQTLSVVSKLGLLGKIKTYVCCGDNGKTINDFIHKLHVSGKIWLVHDKVYNHESLPPIEVVLERGSIEGVADEELAYDYISDVASEKLSKIPSESIDLVTMNQGLHHIPLENLFGFLREVMRMLKCGGVFIIREHDLKLSSAEVPHGDGKTPYAMLDLAHSVFNAVTGVAVKDEIEEIRAFRSILEWRKILESLGFVDTLVYEIEDGDPTWDEMLCFRKPIKETLTRETLPSIIESMNQPLRAQKECEEPPIIGLVNTLLSQVPEFVTSNASTLLQYLSQVLPKLQNKLTDLVLVAIPYLISQNEVFGSESRAISKQVGDILEPIVTNFFKQFLGFVNGSLTLLSDSELNPSFNFKNLVHTTEPYLLMPYLQRKVQIAPDDANQMEKKIVSLLENYLPSLLPQKPLKDCDEGPSSFDRPDTVDSDHIDEGNSVSASEVQAFVMELAETLPGILDTRSMLLHSGFSLPQQASLVAQFGGNDLSSASAKVASYLDRRTWEVLKTHLTTAVATGDLPTKSLLLKTSPKIHIWHIVLKTLFTSPKLKLNDAAIFGIRLIGLAEVGALYKEVKNDVEAKEGHPTHIQYDIEVVSHLESIDSAVDELGKEWADDIVESTITYTGASSEEDCLWDVAEVMQAKFGYKSITSRKVDITEQLQSVHASIHSKLANPEYSFLVPDGVKMGWLPIHESLLIEMRNKGNIQREVGDVFRKSLVNVATLGAAGNNQLKIKYRRIRQTSDMTNSGRGSIKCALDSGHFESLKTIAKDLNTFLESNDIMRPDLHPNDGPYTWFKLVEWMQVEILDELVKSLEHTPWYRFPFVDFMKTYFDVFQKQCNIVQEKYGMIQAYGSWPFLIDLVPGIVMSVLFSQLKLFAIPIQIAIPDGYEKDANFHEDVVLHLPLNLNRVVDWDEYLKTTLDNRILKAKPLPNNFMVCSLPTFKTMGEILEKISIRFPSARVFQISNQFEVQVRLSLNRSQSNESGAEQQEEQYEADLQRILSTAGVELKMSYHYPNTRHSSGAASKPEKTFYSLEVHCLALLDVFQICNLLPNHKVEQVYDFHS